MKSIKTIRVLFAMNANSADSSLSQAIDTLPDHILPQVVTSGQKARSIIETAPSSVDIVVAAYDLEDFSGVDLFALIHSQNIPIPVIVSVDYNPEHLQDLLSQGVEFYILKDPERRCFDLLPILIPHVLHNHQLRLEKEEETEERISSIIEAIPDIVFELNGDGSFTHVNQEIKLLGWSPSELAGMHFINLLVQEDIDILGKGLSQLVSGEKTAVKANLRFRSKDGHPVPVKTHIVAIKNDNRPVRMVGVAKDVSEFERVQVEQKKLEEQLRQAQKMEAVGRLAGGIAHDFNNILTGITGYTELILATLELNNPIYSDLEEIHSAAERAARLTHQLLASSRKQIIAPKTINLNSIIEQSHKMLGRVIGENISLRFHGSPQLWPVKADPSQIDQVLLNLIVNARDAMPDIGTLTIQTYNEILDDSYTSKHDDQRPGSYVVLKIADTGCGMSEDTLKHIFEPFFTTKPQDKGTGLGLSTVYGIVKQNRGFIEVRSKVGSGTTFEFYFPRAFEKVSEITHPPQAQEHCGTETILLVEDEDIVRVLARNILTKHGYKVIEAADGESAYEICLEQPDNIELVLTDVIMPNMNGKDMVDQMLKIKPDLKSIFMSGYTADAIAKHGVLEHGINFIQKPFSVKTLAKKVREVLDK